MYWSHSKAKFVGVSWFGDPYTDGDLVYNYHASVRNAFTTAPVLAQQINALSGGTKTVAGHSLACGIIASALTDDPDPTKRLAVNQVCFIDAALARECFDGDSAEDLANMAHPGWMRTDDASQPNYDRRLWASDWCKLFLGGSDARQTLTWKGRFAGAVPSIYNFYSSTEDVLASQPGLPGSVVLASLRDSGFNGRYAWTVQEKTKGNSIMIVPWAVHAGSDYGGWGMNIKDPLFDTDPVYWKWVNSYDYIGRMIKTPTELGTIPDAVLRRSPVFEPGWGKVGNQDRLLDTDPANYCGPSWIFDLYGASAGNTIAADPAKRAQLLAEAIPALSTPAGSSSISTLLSGRNHNSPAEFADLVNWPRGRLNSSGPAIWHHSDMREVAYVYLYKLYDQLSSLSNP
jgi:hypothetical protein